MAVKYYKICNDDTTLVFEGLDSSGNVTTVDSEIVSYKVNGLIDKNTYSSINIPKEYNGLPVTTIGSFSKLSNIYKLITPDTITRYWDGAFSGNINLKYAEINGIGNNYYVFRDCTSLEKVVIGDGLNTSLQWFSGCSNLNEVVLKGKITIADRVFEGCNKLETITLAEGNNNYKFVDDILYSYDETKIILCLPKKQVEFTIPSTVTTIATNGIQRTRYNEVSYSIYSSNSKSVLLCSQYRTNKC